MTSALTWSPGMRSLGPAVVALGAFDGVHLGHQALLASARAEARHRECFSVALTFDRDPDQVVRPEAASPQLLTLEERVLALSETGIDVVLVVPFTPEIAAMEATAFLDDVLAASLVPVAIHVGADFHFGARALGDLDTLYVWGVEHNCEIRPHQLVATQGEVVSATRIRALIAAGDVRAASDLLGRPPSVSGIVHAGRGEGASLGFATANITPAPHAALPADGVYAAIARLEDGREVAAAVSVGVPPTFPTATDYVEAHLLDYQGDLYGRAITLKFLERLREQRAFAEPSELSSAIALDVERTRTIAGEYLPAEASANDTERCDRAFVDDPLALEAAEAAVAGMRDVRDDYVGYDDTWVCVFGPHRMSLLLQDGGSSAAILTGPLTAAGIPFVWDPFPPERAQNVRPDFNWQREFRLFVPADQAEDARLLLPDRT